MLFVFQKIVNSLVTPPGLFIVLLFVSILIVWRKRHEKHMKFLTTLLIIITVFLYILSTNLGSNLFVIPLEKESPPNDNYTGDAIVILSAGSLNTPAGDQIGPTSLLRTYKGFQIYEKTNKPIIVTGGNVLGKSDKTLAEIMKDTLESWGVPSDKIILENKAKTTEENAEYSFEICKNEGWLNVDLVTSAIHMKRAYDIFKKFGFTTVNPVPSNYYAEYGDFSSADLLPNAGSLEANSSAIHEYIGQIYYSFK